MLITKNTSKSQKRRVVILIEHGIKRAIINQSQKAGCKSRPDHGSLSEWIRATVIEKLEALGVNCKAIIKSGL